MTSIQFLLNQAQVFRGYLQLFLENYILSVLVPLLVLYMNHISLERLTFDIKFYFNKSNKLGKLIMHTLFSIEYVPNLVY